MNIRQIIKEEIQKVFISESYDSQELKTPQEILKYINELHLKGHERRKFEDWEWINSFDYFKLEMVNLSDLKFGASFPGFALDYAKKITELPPIVVDSISRYIIDGNHRAQAAVIRGDKTIQAYVGYKN